MNGVADYIAIGRFGKARGVDGEAFINVLTDNPDRFRSGMNYWTDNGDSGYRKLEFASIREVSGRFVVKIDGIDNPESVKRELTNLFIYVRREDLGQAPEGKYYHFDLVGCRVEDEEGKIYGIVAVVQEFPANDILVIESEDKKKKYLPMVKEYITAIDIEAKKILVNPSGGIFGEDNEV